jgi:outer membrane lipoprotein SlyB
MGESDTSDTDSGVSSSTEGMCTPDSSEADAASVYGGETVGTLSTVTVTAERDQPTPEESEMCTNLGNMAGVSAGLIVTGIGTIFLGPAAGAVLGAIVGPIVTSAVQQDCMETFSGD